jgi:hypothetical protein
MKALTIFDVYTRHGGILPMGTTQGQQVRCNLPHHPGKLNGLDRRPSAHLYDDTQMMYCYVCGGPFNPIKYHALMTGGTYSEAKVILKSEGYDVDSFVGRVSRNPLNYKELSGLRAELIRNPKQGILSVRKYYANQPKENPQTTS